MFSKPLEYFEITKLNFITKKKNTSSESCISSHKQPQVAKNSDGHWSELSWEQSKCYNIRKANQMHNLRLTIVLHYNIKN
jgi:hypothetical protein